MKLAAAFFAGAVLLAGPALAADKGVGVPPAPKSTEVRDVQAWIRRYVADDGWVYATSSDRMAVLFSPSAMRMTKAGLVRFWYRTELFSPEYVEGQVVRSYYTLSEIDCTDQKQRFLAADLYALNSMGGEVVKSVDSAGAAWEYDRPGTLAEALGRDVCAYVERLAAEVRQDAARSGASGLKGHF